MKYNISSQGQNLTLSSDTEGGLYDLFEKTFNIPSVIKSTKTLYFLENGKSSISLRFHEVGTINGLTATSLEDAFDKITAFIATLGGAGGSTVDSAFTQKLFLATMSVAHDTANPNFYIDVTANFNLSITGTVNGDAGMINLNFAGTQVATLNSTVNKVITGAGATIQVYFIHDAQGLKWYRDETGGGSGLVSNKTTTTTSLSDLANLEILANSADVKAFIRIADNLRQFLFDADLKGGATSTANRLNTISNFSSSNAGGFVSGYYYDNNPHGQQSTLAGSADRIIISPYYSNFIMPITQIGCNVTTAVAASLFKVVIYSSDSNGFPDALLYQSGDLSGAVTGYIFENLSFTFQSGVKYYLGVHHSSTCTLSSINPSSAYSMGIGQTGQATSQVLALRRTLAYATGVPTSWNFIIGDMANGVNVTSIRFKAQ